MATAAPITGASAGATIISFPMTPMRRFRRELSACFKAKMVDRWFARMQRIDSGLSEAEYIELAKRGLEHGRKLRQEGC